MNRTELTARSRRSLSAPATALLDRGLLCGRILDFGAGKGDLAKFLDGDIVAWDPNFAPRRPRGKFDVVCCIYVLNVLPPRERKAALADAQSFVRPGGRLYCAVRRDRFDEGRTTKGTEQYHVYLPLESLICKAGAFEIYTWHRG